MNPYLICYMRLVYMYPGIRSAIQPMYASLNHAHEEYGGAAGECELGSNGGVETGWYLY